MCKTFLPSSLHKQHLLQSTAISFHSVVEVISCRKDMQHAVVTPYSQQERALLAGLHTVYFRAKKNLANDLFTDLKLFQVLQVCLCDLFS